MRADGAVICCAVHYQAAQAGASLPSDDTDTDAGAPPLAKAMKAFTPKKRKGKTASVDKDKDQAAKALEEESLDGAPSRLRRRSTYTPAMLEPAVRRA